MKEFPPFRLDTVNQCLWRHVEAGNDERILLTPKEFAVLRHLVERAGRLVTQDELLDAVWPEAHVEPAVLKNQILSIRNALGDRPKSPVFIETLARRRYRFIASVRDGVASTNLGGDSLSRKLVGREAALGELRGALGKSLRDQESSVSGRVGRGAARDQRCNCHVGPERRISMGAGSAPQPRLGASARDGLCRRTGDLSLDAPVGQTSRASPHA